MSTCRAHDVYAAVAAVLPGAEPTLVRDAGARVGIAGAAAALVDVPAADVARVAAEIRSRLRTTTEGRSVLVGMAVGDDDNAEQLLRLAAEALVSGHGVASDHRVLRRRLSHAAPRGVRGRFRSRYDRCTTAQKRWYLFALTLLVGLVGPFCVYSLCYAVGVDLAEPVFWSVLAILILTAASVVAEMLHAVSPPDLPPADSPKATASDPVRTGVWPKVSLVVAAYLPNETEVLPGTVEAMLAADYAGELEVVVAGNGDGPGVDELKAVLRARMRADGRLRLVLHPGSRSKAENVNAALEVVTGDVVGVFDADHQLASNAVTRAARWVAGGYADIVQGHNVIRNGDASPLTQMVAVEFEGIYALAHPGRARLHGFGIFGGSNGFWRRDVLDRLRMRPWMLTEDIDVSTRALLSGAVIASDRWLVSRELAPESGAALWSQRMRWSQGWAQVSRVHLRNCLRSSALGFRQRTGFAIMLGLREVYPWIAPQMFPLLAFQVLVRHQQHLHWLLPPFVLATVAVTSVGPLQIFFAWRFSAPELRVRHRWFWAYLVKTGPFYGEWKAIVNRCAHVREWLGDDAWTVTPRTGAQAPMVSASAGEAEAAAEELVLAADGAAPVEPLPPYAERAVADRAAGLPADVPQLRLPEVWAADAAGRVRVRPVHLTRRLAGVQ